MDNLKTSFGKRKVSQNEKTNLVQEVFSKVASKYDVMNDVMSFGTHRLWKKELVDYMNIQPSDKIIDVGSGTGDLINLIFKKKINENIYSVDLNQEMLNLSKKRFINKKIKFVKANAEKLPFENNLFDKYVIAFCLRNVTNIDKSIKEAHRVLKPGGSFFCLEFSKPQSEIVALIYNNYKRSIIPWLGNIITKNKSAYKYLEESIDIFPDQINLLKILKGNKFENTNFINLFDGIVSIHRGFKI